MTQSRSRHTLSSTVAGVIGNVMEWYDFALFGFFAPIIAVHFFPSSDNPLTSLLQTYGVFAAGSSCDRSARRCSAISATGSGARGRCSVDH